MGHSHYWYIPLDRLEEARAAVPSIAKEFERLLPVLPPLAGPVGKGRPVLEGGEVLFNGPIPEDYETFSFPGLASGRPIPSEARPGHHVGIVKTGRRPYDLAVLAFLLIAKHHLGDAIQLESDASVLEWFEPARLVGEVLGHAVDPYAALGRAIHVHEDGDGRWFGVEARSIHHADRLIGVLGEEPGWPFRPPYRLVGRVRLPRQELEALLTGIPEVYGFERETPKERSAA